MINNLEFKSFPVASTTPVVMASAGRNLFIHTVVVPKATAGTVTFANKNATPVTQFTLPVATAAGTYVFDAVFTDGMDVTMSAVDLVIVNGFQY